MTRSSQAIFKEGLRGVYLSHWSDAEEDGGRGTNWRPWHNLPQLASALGAARGFPTAASSLQPPSAADRADKSAAENSAVWSLCSNGLDPLLGPS